MTMAGPSLVGRVVHSPCPQSFVEPSPSSTMQLHTTFCFSPSQIPFEGKGREADMLENVLGAGVTSPDSPGLKTDSQRLHKGDGDKQEALSMNQRSGFLKV